MPSVSFTRKNRRKPSPRRAGLRRGIGLLCALLSIAPIGCADAHVPPNELSIAKAESIIDAFYSWNAAALAFRLASAEGTEAMRSFGDLAQFFDKKEKVDDADDRVAADGKAADGNTTEINAAGSAESKRDAQDKQS